MTSLNILLVEDDRSDAMEFERAICKSGAAIGMIQICTYAAETLTLLDTWLPSCIFLNYQLPKTNGLEFLKKIKRMVPHIPVIVFTANAEKRFVMQIMRAGALDHILRAEITPKRLLRTFHTLTQKLEVETVRAKAQRELVAKQELIHKIALLSPNIIYVIDIENWTSIFHNTRIRDILGYSEDEIILDANNSFTKIINLDDQLMFRKHYLHIRHSLKDGQVVEKEFRLKHKDGSDIWFITKEVSFRRNSKGTVWEVLGTAIDITNRRLYETELRQAKKKAEEATHAKSDFLSTMSHEIRTPMNAIIGYTDLLLKSNIADQERKYLKTIKYSADNLLIILNDILDFSKIEAGKFQLEYFEFDLLEKLDYLLQTFEMTAKEKAIDFTVGLDSDVPQILFGDAYRLNQILINLVGNAVKFTEEGGFVKVRVSLNEDYGDAVRLKIEVSDSGIGIPEDQLSHIFESFAQAHKNDATHYFGGTGLGLTITRKITSLMQGSITTRSKLGEGTTFTVSLRFGKGEQTIQNTIPEAVTTASLKGYRILAAEDILANQILLGHLLQKWEADYVICNNGEELLNTLKTGEFDLILMDIQMPVMDGIAATKEIQSLHPRYAHIPVIAFTADTFAEASMDIASCNFSDFITKPFKAEELAEVIFKRLQSVN